MGVTDRYHEYKSIRVRPELRAAQVERAAFMSPALTLYFAEKYDLGETQLSCGFVKVSFIQALVRIATTRGLVLEVPEPLWLRFLPKTAVLAVIWKASGIVLRQRREVVTYAIENNDLASLISPRRRPPRLLLKLAGWFVGILLRLTVDRIAFGSSAAERLYQSLPGVRSIASQRIEELPTAKFAEGLPFSAATPSRAVFLGELDHRKGIKYVMSAWSSVEESRPGAHITIIGNGRLAHEVEAWCLAQPATRSFAGFVQHDQVPVLLSSAEVLVAPSLREGRWREQIGLPIVEALSMGLTVVSTDETGLARWLRDHGHSVIPAKDVDNQLAEALLAALDNPLERSEVLRSLPDVAGRIAADAWLHSRI